MTKKELVDLLELFKGSRQKLLNDFTNKDPKIFIPIFKYESNSMIMEISVEKFFIGWLDYHFIMFDRLPSTLAQQHSFFQIMQSFFNNHIDRIPPSDIEGKSFFIELLKDKQRLLQQLVNINDKSDLNYNKALLEYERCKVLFSREINLMREEL